MDICTLVIPLTVTLLSCRPGPQVCHVDVATQREFCAPGPVPDCNHASPYYECVREDKTAYTLPWTTGPSTINAEMLLEQNN